jgi:hypothetical protein
MLIKNQRPPNLCTRPLQAKRSLNELTRMLRDAEREAAAAGPRVEELAQQRGVLEAAASAARGGCEELAAQQEELRRRLDAAAVEK